MAECKHEDFEVVANVIRLSDSKRLTMEIKVNCKQCKIPMIFLGCPNGWNYEHPTTNFDRTMLDTPIHPKGEELPPLPEGMVKGYTIHPPKTRRMSGKDRPV